MFELARKRDKAAFKKIYQMMYPRFRLLVADDRPEISELICHMFRLEDVDVECRRAEDGKSAIAMASSFNPDVIIIDYMMPGMNGIDTAREINKLRPNQRVVLFSSAVLDAFERMDAKHAGIDVVLDKSQVNRIVEVTLELLGE